MSERGTTAGGGIFRHSLWDAVMVAAALLQGLLFVALFAWRHGLAWPWIAACYALGVCWNSNTISHNHLHNPFFRQRWMNRGFSLYLTLLVGIPQSLWRDRHLWHHAGEPVGWRLRWNGQKLVEFGALAAWAGTLAWLDGAFFGAVILPGLGVGLLFCQLQGHYEHHCEEAQGAGISHYSFWYNFLWFNDGFHAEHHRHPRMHWRALPGHRLAAEQVQVSPWPPHLRWWGGVLGLWSRLQNGALGQMERVALGWKGLQRWMVHSHRKAFEALLPAFEGREPEHVVIVGGGLFPRTLLALQSLWPDARYTILEQDPGHIARAQEVLQRELGPGLEVGFCQGRFPEALPEAAEVVVIPMAYAGDRQELYARPLAPYVFVHDWPWRRKGQRGVWIPEVLLKRLNLIVGPPQP